MTFKLTRSVLTGAATFGVAGAARAAPLINLQLLGSTTYSAAGAGYTSNVIVTPGQTVYYELVATLAAAGTTNTTRSPTLTIAKSQTAYDGLDGIGLSLTDARDATLSLGTLENGFGNNVAYGANEAFDMTGSGAPGNPYVTHYNVLEVHALQNTGTFLPFTSTVIVAANSLVAGSFSTYSTDMLSLAMPSGFDAEINTTATTFADKDFVGAQNTGADPWVGFANLTMSAVPAPGIPTASCLLVAGAGLLGFYRRRRIA